MRWILVLSLIVLVATQDDDRLTINRLGYGVFYERIGEISDAGGMIYHPVTWSLIIPEFVTPHMDLIPCNETNNVEIIQLCESVNSLIATVNDYAYTTVNSAKEKLKTAVDIVPESDAHILISQPGNSSLLEDEEGASARKKRSTRRTKREVPTFEDIEIPPDVINPPTDENVPDWIKDDNEDVQSNLEYLIPGRFAGEVFTNLFNMPSSRTIKNTERNLKSLGNAVFTNKESIVNLGKQLGYIMQLTDKRLDTITMLGTIVKNRLSTVREYIRQFQLSFYGELNKANEDLIFLNNFKTQVISVIYPELNRVKMIASLIDTLADMWTFGIINLTSGFISEYIITQDMIKDALESIKTDKLTLAGFRTYKLMSQTPAFYYKLPRISYAKTLNKLLVTIEVPLYKPNKKLTLYRVNAFPLPVTAGLEGDTPEAVHGYTYIVDLPAFLAVSENLESYIELTEAQYLACEGAVKGVQNCGNSVGVPRMTVGKEKSCAYAIFSDSPLAVKKYCQTAFTKDIPQGSARQLSSDSSFLIQSGGSDLYWSMTCPASPTKPYSKIKPCSLCRLKIGCGCSLIGPNFRIPTHISGCDYTFEDLPTTTKIYQRNVATITEFVSDIDLQEVRSYAEKVDELWPEIKMPVINYTVPDHLDNYVEVSRKYAQEFAKGAALIQKNLTLFKDKQDAALVEVRNYTDQEVDRAGSVLGALESLFTTIFGGETWALLTVIFGPIGLSFIALFISLLVAVPTIIQDIQAYREKKSDREEEAQLLKEALKDVKLENNYSFWPRATTSVPASVVSVDEYDEGVTYITPL